MVSPGDLDALATFLDERDEKRERTRRDRKRPITAPAQNKAKTIAWIIGAGSLVTAVVVLANFVDSWLCTDAEAAAAHTIISTENERAHTELEKMILLERTSNLLQEQHLKALDDKAERIDHNIQKIADRLNVRNVERPESDP